VKTSRSAGYLPLPTTVEQVTATWLQSALRDRFPEIEVADAVVDEVIGGTSTKIRVTAVYKGARGLDRPPEKLIVKGGFERHSQRVSAIYSSESRYYRELAGRMTLNVPRSFFAESDPDGYQSIVVMEDLKARAVRFCDPLVPHGYELTAAFLDALASTHAKHWGSPELNDGGQLDWVRTPFDTDSHAFYDYYMAADQWIPHMRTPVGAAVPRMFHDAEWFGRAIESMSRFHDSCTKTLTHGDTHLGNLYVEGDNLPGFLDAQPRRSPWFHDVVYHIVCALDVEDRRRWDYSLLTHYLERLRVHGVLNPPSLEEAREAYCRYLPYGLLIFMINEAYFQSEPINTAYSVRFSMAALDNRVRELYP
jgi:aminoglycoside phosphotransferase (APT) family kinase protein